MLFNLINEKDNFRFLKFGIWIYFFLLIFEGAARKWILPSQASLIFIIRDPIALILIYMAIKRSVLKLNASTISVFILGIVSFFTSQLFCHSSIIVALFGLRVFFLHFPLIFIIQKVFNRDDVVKMGIVILKILIFMICLTIIQFFSAQGSWFNKSVGGENFEEGFGGAMGFFRPSGTFSFINGLSLFYGLASAFLFYFILNIEKISKILLNSAIFATILSIPFTISRTILFQNILCLIFYSIVVLKHGVNIKVITLIIIVFAIIGAFGSKYLKTGFEVFESRFKTASDDEGGITKTLIDRPFITLWTAVSNYDSDHPFGRGLGANSNVGFKLLKTKKEEYISDYEWSRTISELGFFLGFMFILLRINLTISMVKIAIKAYIKKDYLPWMLLSYGFMQTLQAQVVQPTSLGFIILITGLVLSLNKAKIFVIK